MDMRRMQAHICKEQRNNSNRLNQSIQQPEATLPRTTHNEQANNQQYRVGEASAGQALEPHHRRDAHKACPLTQAGSNSGIIPTDFSLWHSTTTQTRTQRMTGSGRDHYHTPPAQEAAREGSQSPSHRRFCYHWTDWSRTKDVKESSSPSTCWDTKFFPTEEELAHILE